MKPSILLMGMVLLASAPFAHSDSVNDRTHGPCFRVTIQNNPVNESSVQQNCDQNFNRTVQAGKQNSTQTIQTGELNDNKVRQYQYAHPGSLDRTRGDRRPGN